MTKLFLLFILLGFQAQSQTSKNQEEFPYYYIGKYDNKHFYVKSMFTVKSNIVSLYELGSDGIYESEKIALDDKIIHQLSCYQEKFYAITSSPDGENFYMTTFNNSLKEDQSIPVLNLSKDQMRGLKSGDYTIKFYTKKDRFAIVLIEHDIVTCSINFSSMKSATFSIKGGINFNYVSDVYLEDGLDLYLSRRSDLFHFKDEKLSTSKPDNSPLLGRIDELMFVENDSEPYLLSLLDQGSSVSGFTYCALSEINSESFHLNECALNRQKTNSKKELSTFYNSIVRAEIIDNKLICTAQRVVQAINESILISCIDLEKHENCWNFEAISIHDAPYIWRENYNRLNRSSISFVHGNKLIFLFNASTKKMNPAQFKETDKRVITYDYSIQTTIMKSEINLDTGKGITTPLHENYLEEPFKLFTSCFHLTDKNELFFLTYKFTDKKNYLNYDEMLSGQTKVEIIQL